MMHPYPQSGRSPFLAGILFILVLGLPAGCSSVTEPEPEPPREMSALEKRISQSLERAGANRAEIEAFLASGQGEKAQAAEFLVANMPTADLCSLNRKALAENLDLAFRIREELPWGKTPTFPYFLHYVLPHRVTQERKRASARTSFFHGRNQIS